MLGKQIMFSGISDQYFYYLYCNFGSKYYGGNIQIIIDNGLFDNTFLIVSVSNVINETFSLYRNN